MRKRNNNRLLETIKKSCLILILIPICLFMTACNSNKNYSAYQIAIQNGFTGTEKEWLESLKGKSAYELALENGFVGTEKEWLETLKGKDGANGSNGKDGQDLKKVDTYQLYETAKEKGELPDENFSYLDFLKQYFSVTSNYDFATANKNLMSVVSVYSYSSTLATSSSNSGSGVIYSLDKQGNAYIITNYHVTYQNSSNMYPFYKLYLYAQDTPIPATFVGASRQYDLAVLKVSESDLLLKSNAQAACFREYDPMLSETCYAIGNTEKAGITLTKGTISVELETISMTIGGVKSYYKEVRHDAYISHGNSGGGLFDSDGMLIGITNGGKEQTLMNYAIPVTFVKAVCDNIIKNNTESGIKKVKTFCTGIEFNLEAESTITIYDSETSKITTHETVKINQIEVDSAFAKQGILKAGDIIKSIEINGKLYDNIKTYTLKVLLLSASAGDNIKVTVERTDENENTSEISATIVLSSLDAKEIK